MAEQESRNISTNVKWGMKEKFNKGSIMLNHTRFLGYTKDDDGNLVIVPSEANIIKRIYREYLDGATSTQICRKLMKEKIKSPTCKDKWYETTVMSILQNEKYKGCAILGKTYKPDVLSPKRLKN